MSTDQKCPECNGFRGLPRMLHHDDIPKECDNPFHKEVPVPEAIPEPEKVVEMPAPPMATQEQGDTGKVPWHPICPHCGQAPGIRAKKINFGGTVLMVICCDQCLKMLGVTQVLELTPMPSNMMTH